MFRFFSLVALLCYCVVTSATGKLDDVSVALKSKNYQEARELLKPLAIKGDAEAQFMLGTLYSDGHAGENKVSAGVRWLKLAAKQNHHKAATELGKMYASGRSVPMDQELSEKWYTLAGKIGKEQGKEEEDCD